MKRLIVFFSKCHKYVCFSKNVKKGNYLLDIILSQHYSFTFNILLLKFKIGECSRIFEISKFEIFNF